MTKTYYFDTSALIKLYVKETGSLWIKKIYDTFSQTITFTKIGIVEAAAALARRQRLSDISQHDQRLLYIKMLRDANRRFRVFAVSDDVIYEAAALTQRYPLRGYDAVHLAAALEINRQFIINRLPSLTFVSADDKLSQSAIGEGLTTENPNNHL